MGAIIKPRENSAYNKLVTEKKEIIANAELIRRTLCDITSLQEEKRRLESEMAVLVDIVQGFGPAPFFIF